MRFYLRRMFVRARVLCLLIHDVNEGQMHNKGETFDHRGGWTDNPHPPAIIPPSGQPMAAPFGRRVGFTLSHGRSILLAVSFASIASATGFLTAALWPWAHLDKTGPVVMAILPSLTGNSLAGETPARDTPAGDKEASNAGDSTDTDANMTNLAATPAAGIIDPCQITSPAPQLVVNMVLHANEPASLGLKVESAPEGAQLVICGLAANAVFSAGQSVGEKTWTLPASEIAKATVTPPQGFVGPMKLDVALLNTDKTLADRRTLDLQWLPETPPAPSVKPQKVEDAQLNRLLEDGVRLKAAGNIADARAIFSRIAQAGDSRAAFMLAETYDPIALAKRQLLPADSDMELARIWYRKAHALGAQEASGRLERLATW
jgi:hypothetical protein